MEHSAVHDSLQLCMTTIRSLSQHLVTIFASLDLPDCSPSTSPCPCVRRCRCLDVVSAMHSSDSSDDSRDHCPLVSPYCHTRKYNICGPFKVDMDDVGFSISYINKSTQTVDANVVGDYQPIQYKEKKSAHTSMRTLYSTQMKHENIEHSTQVYGTDVEETDKEDTIKKRSKHVVLQLGVTKDEHEIKHSQMNEENDNTFPVDHESSLVISLKNPQPDRKYNRISPSIVNYNIGVQNGIIHTKEEEHKTKSSAILISSEFNDKNERIVMTPTKQINERNFKNVQEITIVYNGENDTGKRNGEYSTEMSFNDAKKIHGKKGISKSRVGDDSISLQHKTLDKNVTGKYLSSEEFEAYNEYLNLINMDKEKNKKKENKIHFEESTAVHDNKCSINDDITDRLKAELENQRQISNELTNKLILCLNGQVSRVFSEKGEQKNVISTKDQKSFLNNISEYFENKISPENLNENERRISEKSSKRISKHDDMDNYPRKSHLDKVKNSDYKSREYFDNKKGPENINENEKRLSEKSSKRSSKHDDIENYSRKSNLDKDKISDYKPVEYFDNIKNPENVNENERRLSEKSSKRSSKHNDIENYSKKSNIVKDKNNYDKSVEFSDLKSTDNLNENERKISEKSTKRSTKHVDIDNNSKRGRMAKDKNNDDKTGEYFDNRRSSDLSENKRRVSEKSSRRSSKHGDMDNYSKKSDIAKDMNNDRSSEKLDENERRVSQKLSKSSKHGDMENYSKKNNLANDKNKNDKSVGDRVKGKDSKSVNFDIKDGVVYMTLPLNEEKDSSHVFNDKGVLSLESLFDENSESMNLLQKLLAFKEEEKNQSVKEVSEKSLVKSLNNLNEQSPSQVMKIPSMNNIIASIEHDRELRNSSGSKKLSSDNELPKHYSIKKNIESNHLGQIISLNDINTMDDFNTLPSVRHVDITVEHNIPEINERFSSEKQYSNHTHPVDNNVIKISDKSFLNIISYKNDYIDDKDSNYLPNVEQFRLSPKSDSFSKPDNRSKNVQTRNDTVENSINKNISTKSTKYPEDMTKNLLVPQKTSLNATNNTRKLSFENSEGYKRHVENLRNQKIEDMEKYVDRCSDNKDISHHLSLKTSAKSISSEEQNVDEDNLSGDRENKNKIEEITIINQERMFQVEASLQSFIKATEMKMKADNDNNFKDVNMELNSDERISRESLTKRNGKLTNDNLCHDLFLKQSKNVRRNKGNLDNKESEGYGKKNIDEHDQNRLSSKKDKSVLDEIRIQKSLNYVEDQKKFDSEILKNRDKNIGNFDDQTNDKNSINFQLNKIPSQNNIKYVVKNATNTESSTEENVAKNGNEENNKILNSTRNENGKDKIKISQIYLVDDNKLPSKRKTLDKNSGKMNEHVTNDNSKLNVQSSMNKKRNENGRLDKSNNLKKLENESLYDDIHQNDTNHFQVKDIGSQDDLESFIESLKKTIDEEKKEKIITPQRSPTIESNDSISAYAEKLNETEILIHVSPKTSTSSKGHVNSDKKNRIEYMHKLEEKLLEFPKSDTDSEKDKIEYDENGVKKVIKHKRKCPIGRIEQMMKEKILDKDTETRTKEKNKTDDNNKDNVESHNISKHQKKKSFSTSSTETTNTTLINSTEVWMTPRDPSVNFFVPLDRKSGRLKLLKIQFHENDQELSQYDLVPSCCAVDLQMSSSSDISTKNENHMGNKIHHMIDKDDDFLSYSIENNQMPLLNSQSEPTSEILVYPNYNSNFSIEQNNTCSKIFDLMDTTLQKNESIENTTKDKINGTFLPKINFPKTPLKITRRVTSDLERNKWIIKTVNTSSVIDHKHMLLSKSKNNQTKVQEKTKGKMSKNSSNVVQSNKTIAIVIPNMEFKSQCDNLMKEDINDLCMNVSISFSDSTENSSKSQIISKDAKNQKSLLLEESPVSTLRINYMKESPNEVSLNSNNNTIQRSQMSCFAFY